MAQGTLESRAALGREVCTQFGFVDARGAAQVRDIEGLRLVVVTCSMRQPNSLSCCTKPALSAGQLQVST